AQPPETEPPPVVESVAPPVVVLPPPVILEPPPPPPPAALQGPFDLQKFSQRPKFGQEPPTAPPEPPLPQTPEAVKEGAALAAPDGRVIVKNQGQVTVVHDDTGRFRQQGDQVRTEQTANQTQTTTVVRPDGTEIVTIRDRWGNIVQRYRRNRNGSVEILIGEMEQPGFIGRIFGRGAQPAPPPPLRPPAPINLQFGPLVLSIPQQQYIVESSRANQQQLEQALFAPPVEAVERPYTLEEIRRSGRLRDKVRRIDFDTITFDTGKATVPDNQIARMQSIGLALRDAIQQDPTQVFLIEGHTDAVGSDLYNLALSDRRAETVAEILSYYFGVPPENMVSQGYGEQYLKIPTVAAERQNRRVAFRNITYLLRAGQ
ncbi:MAG: OmpA family protein, partial [Bauldia sp.]|nr:OmpA family protein [Bauldia sp.]